MPPDLLHGDRVRRRAVLLASGGGADLDGEQPRDARRDGNIDLLHARGGGGFSGVEWNEILVVADLHADGGEFGDPGGEDLEDVSGFRGRRRRVLLVVLIEDPMREHGWPGRGQGDCQGRAADAIDGHHQAGGVPGAQGRGHLQVDLRIARVDQGSGVQHLADDDRGCDGRGRGRRWHRGDGQDDGDALAAGNSGVDDDGGQRGSGRQRLGVGRNLHGGFVGSGRRIEDQPAGAPLVDHGDTPGHAAYTRVVDAETTRGTGHGATGRHCADEDGRGFDQEFGEGGNRSGAIAEELAIALHGDGGEARNGGGGRSGGHGGDRRQGDGLLRDGGRGGAGQGDESGELRRLLHGGVGGSHFVDRVARTVGEKDFADRTERYGAGALRRRDGKTTRAGGVGARDANQHQGSAAGQVLADGLRQVQIAARGGLERVRTGHGVRDIEVRGSREAAVVHQESRTGIESRGAGFEGGGKAFRDPSGSQGRSRGEEVGKIESVRDGRSVTGDSGAGQAGEHTGLRVGDNDL